MSVNPFIAAQKVLYELRLPDVWQAYGRFAGMRFAAKVNRSRSLTETNIRIR